MTLYSTHRTSGPGCLVQLLWFVLVGWWLGQAWAAVAWFLIVTIVGMPFGIAMLNMLPQIMALRKREEVVVMRNAGHTYVSGAPQVNFLLRALYFVLIGWWLAGLWIEAMYALMASVIGLPLGFWMLDRVPLVVSLRR